MDEDLFSKFEELFGPGYSSRMAHNVPYLSIEPDAIEMINRTLQSIKETDTQARNPQLADQANQILTQQHIYNPEEVRRTNRALYKEFQSKATSEVYKKMQKERQKLPAWEMRKVITTALQMYNVVIISGMTGCGKTTQVPQFIVDEALETDAFDINIICTQPRRISAISIAERVAQERDDTLGSFVGYQIRLDGVMSHYTRLLFCTTGIVLRRLEGDPDLQGVTHIIVDEVHERSEQSDFLILILKKLLLRRPDLRVILMSATIDAELFSEYFGGCPVIEIPGKPYPVKQFFLEDFLDKVQYQLPSYSENVRNDIRHSSVSRPGTAFELVPDSKLSESQLKMRYPRCGRKALDVLFRMDFEKINYDLLADLLEWLVTGNHEFPKEGAVLVFLPGLQEIQAAYDLILSRAEFIINKDKYVVVPLHSSYTSEEQKVVFYTPKAGIRKIVLATNIAETSITINDVVFVVDTGRMKEMSYDHSKSMQSLDMTWVSKSNVLQRMGRAGRVREGVSFHLYTSHWHNHMLKERPVPEIQRNSLEQVVIRTKMLPIFSQKRLEHVMKQLINPPAEESVEGAINRLIDLGALDSKMKLTPLGYHLGSLPVDVRIGKLMLYGVVFRCLDATLTIAATLSFKTPFVSPFKKKEEASVKKKDFQTNKSDILTMLTAYKDWWTAKDTGYHYGYDFCRSHFLSYKTLEMLMTLKQQYVEILSDIGFIKRGIKLWDVQYAASNSSDGVVNITGRELNTNNDNMGLLSALLVAALYPNIVQTIAGQLSAASRMSHQKYKTKKGELVDIHPGSINFRTVFPIGSFLVYHEKVKTKKVYIRDCSAVTNISLLMFAGGEITLSDTGGVLLLNIDEMIKFRIGSGESASLLIDLRSELNRLLSDKISQPEMDLSQCPRSEKIIKCIVYLL